MPLPVPHLRLAVLSARIHLGCMRNMRETPVTFTNEEAKLIRDAMGRQSVSVSCPRCGKALAIGERLAREGSLGSSFEVRCKPCHRVAIITEVPGTRRPASGA